MSAAQVTLAAFASLVLVSLVGGGLYLLLVNPNIVRAEQRGYERGVAAGHAEARNVAPSAEYDRGVAAGRWLTENEHGWGPAANSADVPADHGRSPDFKYLDRPAVPPSILRPVIHYGQR